MNNRVLTRLNAYKRIQILINEHSDPIKPWYTRIFDRYVKLTAYKSGIVILIVHSATLELVDHAKRLTLETYDKRLNTLIIAYNAKTNKTSKITMEKALLYSAENRLATDKYDFESEEK